MEEVGILILSVDLKELKRLVSDHAISRYVERNLDIISTLHNVPQSRSFSEVLENVSLLEYERVYTENQSSHNCALQHFIRMKNLKQVKRAVGMGAREFSRASLERSEVLR